jgi:hypothetical protein
MAENRPNRPPYQLESNDGVPHETASYMQLMYEQAAELDVVERIRDAMGEAVQSAREFAGNVTDAVFQRDRNQ